MSQVYLTNEQLSLFLQIVKGEKIFNVRDNFILFEENNRERIIDKISDYFSLNGLKKDYEPNNLGVKIENLLNKFI